MGASRTERTSAKQKGAVLRRYLLLLFACLLSALAPLLVLRALGYRMATAGPPPAYSALSLSPDAVDVLSALAQNRRHDLLVGCGLPPLAAMPAATQAALKSHIIGLFRQITPTNSFKWRYIEGERGRFDWREPDDIMEWARLNNLSVTMHTALWDHPEGRPDWTRDLTDDELRREIHEFVTAVAERYRGRFHAWDIVNEPINNPYFIERLPGIDRELVGIVRSIDPAATLIVNDYDAVLYPAGTGVMSYAGKLAAYAKSIGADAVGLQLHDPRWFTPEELKGTLNYYRSEGLPVYLSEVTRPSAGGFIYIGVKEEFTKLLSGITPFGEWTDQAQAAAYADILRIAMSDDNVRGVTFWTLWDGRCWEIQLGYKPGFLREDLSDKPCLAEVASLVHALELARQHTAK
jgi:endo-1,4-beta-xylanase